MDNTGYAYGSVQSGIDKTCAIRALKSARLRGEQSLTIAFIGLGNMGAPMARNLVAAGHNVTGYDIAAPCPTGISPAESAEQAVTKKEFVITMLPNGAILRQTAAQILPIMAQGSILIDCSTVDIDSARAVAHEAEMHNLGFVDAPVSGGVVGAENGTLTFMAGGDEAHIKHVWPLLDIMGSRRVHCGQAGAGQAAKICNNMIAGATMIVTCEAFALADGLGLDRQKMFEVVSASSGQSWSMNVYCPATGIGPSSPSDNDYQPGFASELMLKDLRLARQAAQSVNTETPIGTLAMQIYEEFVEKEAGSGVDFSGVMRKFTSE